MGKERAETYLRLLAEAELRRAGDQLRGLDAAAGTDGWSDPGIEHATAERALGKVISTGWILVAAGALDREYLTGFTDDLHAAITVRSRLLNRDLRRVTRHGAMFGPRGRLAMPSRPVGRAMRVTPIGRTLRVASSRPSAVLHLMSLVRTDTSLAAITVVMRLQWPPDGPGTDPETTSAGPRRLSSDQLDQLWAVDDQGTRYTVHFEGDWPGTAPWLGIA